ncbi:hypothetical protein QTI14_13810 [Clostridium perfringens]|nr:hypothetical protein [Clostridium perfringens]
MASNDVIIRLMADVSNLQNGMKKAQAELNKLKGTTEKTSSGISKSLKGVGMAVAGVFAVDKIKDFTMSMIEASAGVQALDSMFEQTFKGDQAKALEGITSQAKEQNINVDRLKGSWASFYGTFRGNGADANKSLELTSRYMKLAGDGSAYYDKSLEDVVGRLKSITMGNFEAGDAIGLNVNATKLGTIATQKYGKKWQDLTDTQKEFLIIDVAEEIYKNSGAMGQGAREATSWLNVTENLKATWERFLGIIGQPALKIATNMVVGLTDAISGAITWVQQFAQWFDDCYKATGNFSEALASTFDNMNMSWAGDLVMAFSEISAKVQEVINWLGQNKMVMDALIGVAGGVAVAFVTLKTAMAIKDTISAFNSSMKIAQQSMVLLTEKLVATKGALTLASVQAGIWTTLCNIGTTVTTAFGVAMAFLTSPIGIVVVAITGLIAVGYLLVKNWETVKEWAVNIFNSLSAETQASIMVIWSALQTFWNVAVALFQGSISVIQGLIITFCDVFKGLLSGTFEAVKGIISAGLGIIKAIFEASLQFIAGMIQNTFNAIKGIIQGVMTVIQGIIHVVWGIITGDTDKILQGLKEIVSGIWMSIQSKIQFVINTIRTIITSGFTLISGTCASITRGIQSTVLGIWHGIGRGIQGIINGVIGGINMMIGALNSLSFDVPDWVPMFGGKHFGFNIGRISPVSWFATGGIVKGTEGGSIVGVGEAGDEAIVPLSNKSRMKPFAQAVAGMMPDRVAPAEEESSGVTIHIGSLVVREEADVKKIAEQLYNLQQRNKRARGIIK